MAWLSVCVLLTGAASAQPRVEAERHRQQAAALLARGDPDGALAAYRAAVRLDPDDAVSHDTIGVILGDRGDLAGAMDAFREAIRLDPGLAAARLHLGLALERSGQPREALASYTQALRLEPRLTEARYGLSSVCAALGDLDGAIALLRHVVTSLPALAEAHYNLGINLWNRSHASGRPGPEADLDDALDALKTAVRLEPHRHAFHAALGQILSHRQDFEGSVASFRQARTLAPDRAEPAYDLGLALRLAGDLDGAGAELRAALARDPAHGLARRALGLVLRSQNDLPGAAAQLRAAVAALPDDAQTHHLLGSTLIGLGEMNEALGPLRRAIDLDPTLTEPRVALAQALARSGQRDAARLQEEAVRRINAEKAALAQAMVLADQAIGLLGSGDHTGATTLLHEALDLSPALVEAHYQLALALMHPFEERDSLARPAQEAAAGIEAALLRVIELEPEHAPAYLQLGRLHASRGERAPARAALGRASWIAPGLVPAQRAHAWLAIQDGDWAAAVAALEAIVAWEPDDDHAALTLGRSLLHQADWVGAVAAFRHAIRLQPERAAAYDGLADALTARGEIDAAARARARARQLDRTSGGAP